MNPDTNELEMLQALEEMYELENDKPIFPDQLVRPNGEPVPEHWSRYTVGEEVELKGYRFRIGHISKGAILLEPVGPVLIGDKEP